MTVKTIPIESMTPCQPVEGGVEVHDLQTTDGTFVVVGDTGPMVVHNCTFSPSPVIPAHKAITKMSSQVMRIPEKMRMPYVVCQDAASEIKLGASFAQKLAAAERKGTIYVSEWARQPFTAYLTVLAGLRWRRKYASEMVPAAKFEFPVLNEETMYVMANSGIMESDETGYRFAAKFLETSTRRSNVNLLDDFLVARPYAVRWTGDGRPVHDASDRYVVQRDPKAIWERSFVDYFVASDILRACQPGIYTFLHRLMTS